MIQYLTCCHLKDWSVHKLLEGRDAPIKFLIATVLFAVEPQKPMGEMLLDFLVVRGASTASKHFLHNAKENPNLCLYVWISRLALAMEALPDLQLQLHPQNLASSPSFHLLTHPCRRQRLLSDPSQLSFLLPFACHCLAGKLKKLLLWFSLYVPLRGS